MAVLGSTNLTGCNSIPDFIATGTLMLFQQTSAPTSWTKEITHNDKALRVVSGTAGSGGSTAFTSVFSSRTPSGNVTTNVSGNANATTLDENTIPSHTHNARASLNNAGNSANSSHFGPYGQDGSVLSVQTASKGNSGSHTHGLTASGSSSFSGVALDFAVAYVDLIIASKL